MLWGVDQNKECIVKCMLKVQFDLGFQTDLILMNLISNKSSLRYLKPSQTPLILSSPMKELFWRDPLLLSYYAYGIWSWDICHSKTNFLVNLVMYGVTSMMPPNGKGLFEMIHQPLHGFMGTFIHPKAPLWTWRHHTINLTTPTYNFTFWPPIQYLPP